MTAPPLILFGAFDRHNFGDLLFPHIAAALLGPRPLVFAGLAQRDLRAYGGHRVEAIADLARSWGAVPARVIHVGGEVLTCTLYEAAIMLLPPQEARAVIIRHVTTTDGETWAKAELGLDQQLAYLAPSDLFRHPMPFLYAGIGGVGLLELPEKAREEALTRLHGAAYLSVRDRLTQANLATHGIAAELVPDPAVLTAELFADRIAAHARQGEARVVSKHFPQGYVAVQFAAEYGDDATLKTLAGQLDPFLGETGLGLVLFRAGAAPWHDELEVYERLRGFMQTGKVHIFQSLQLWDICALLSGVSAYCGSSLHGRIVTESYGRPTVNLVRDRALPSKQRAWAETWDPGGDSLAVPGDLAGQLIRAMAQDGKARIRRADGLASAARDASQSWLARLSQET